MSEDYTWDETTAHGYAVQNAGLKRDNATLAQRVQELTRENAELRARLETVPVSAFLMYYRDSKPTSAQAESVMNILTEWMKSIYTDMVQQINANLRAQVDDEPDAPLTVAAIDDEDGDE